VLRNTDVSQLAQVRGARAAVAGSGGEEVQEAKDIEGHKVLTASAPVARLGWPVFVETPIEEGYARTPMISEAVPCSFRRFRGARSHGTR